MLKVNLWMVAHSRSTILIIDLVYILSLQLDYITNTNYTQRSDI